MSENYRIPLHNLDRVYMPKTTVNNSDASNSIKLVQLTIESQSIRDTNALNQNPTLLADLEKGIEAELVDLGINLSIDNFFTETVGSRFKLKDIKLSKTLQTLTEDSVVFARISMAISAYAYLNFLSSLTPSHINTETGFREEERAAKASAYYGREGFQSINIDDTGLQSIIVDNGYNTLMNIVDEMIAADNTNLENVVTILQFIKDGQNSDQVKDIITESRFEGLWLLQYKGLPSGDPRLSAVNAKLDNVLGFMILAVNEQRTIATTGERLRTPTNTSPIVDTDNNSNINYLDARMINQNWITGTPSHNTDSLYDVWMTYKKAQEIINLTGRTTVNDLLSAGMTETITPVKTNLLNKLGLNNGNDITALLQDKTQTKAILDFMKSPEFFPYQKLFNEYHAENITDIDGRTTSADKARIERILSTQERSLGITNASSKSITERWANILSASLTAIEQKEADEAQAAQAEAAATAQRAVDSSALSSAQEKFNTASGIAGDIQAKPKTQGKTLGGNSGVITTAGTAAGDAVGTVSEGGNIPENVLASAQEAAKESGIPDADINRILNQTNKTPAQKADELAQKVWEEMQRRQRVYDNSNSPLGVKQQADTAKTKKDEAVRAKDSASNAGTTNAAETARTTAENAYKAAEIAAQAAETAVGRRPNRNQTTDSAQSGAADNAATQARRDAESAKAAWQAAEANVAMRQAQDIAQALSNNPTLEQAQEAARGAQSAADKAAQAALEAAKADARANGLTETEINTAMQGKSTPEEQAKAILDATNRNRPSDSDNASKTAAEQAIANATNARDIVGELNNRVNKLREDEDTRGRRQAERRNGGNTEGVSGIDYIELPNLW